MALDGAAAIRYYEHLDRNVFANCLGTVWDAYGSPATRGPQPGRSFATAMDSYNYTRKRHPGDWDPPAGVPVWFGVSPTRTDANRAAGDVGVSVGGGRAWFTDSDRGNTYPGVMTLAARAAEIGRPYLGWTEDFGGNDIAWPGKTSQAGSSVVTEQEQDMNYITIAGRAGARRGGTYAVFSDGKGGYSAVFLGGPGVGPAGLVPVTDEAAIAALQKKISGLA